MDDICVGDYVRTKQGIAKVLEIKTVATKMYGNHDMAYRIDKTRMYVTITNFIKHSKNIIDLIEIGDYVNSEMVHTINYKDKTISINHLNDLGYAENKDLKEAEIKSIVTKEQFSSMQYIVKEE